MKKTTMTGIGISFITAAALGILFGNPLGAGALAKKPYRGEIRASLTDATRAKLADGGCLAATDSIEVDLTYITLPAKAPAANREVNTTVSIPSSDTNRGLAFATFTSTTDSAGRARISIRVSDALSSAQKSINKGRRLTPGRGRSVVSLAPASELITSINVRPTAGFSVRLCR